MFEFVLEFEVFFDGFFEFYGDYFVVFVGDFGVFFGWLDFDVEEVVVFDFEEWLDVGFDGKVSYFDIFFEWVFLFGWVGVVNLDESWIIDFSGFFYFFDEVEGVVDVCGGNVWNLVGSSDEGDLFFGFVFID